MHPPTPAEIWLQNQESELLGQTAGQAEAAVRAAGLFARTIPFPGGWMTSDLRRDRVNLWLTESGTVGSVSAN